MRPESGPMQFGEDWCGVFIRGDNALFYASQVGTALEVLKEEFGQEAYCHIQLALEGLKKVLTSSNQYHVEARQLMKGFKECIDDKTKDQEEQ